MKCDWRKPAWVTFIAQAMQKLTGIDFIAAYAPEMFAPGGYTGDKPALLADGNFISHIFSFGPSDLSVRPSWKERAHA